jgi:menaquinone-9 beta-reductase
MSSDADVVVVGAGPAGCAAAIRLVQAGRSVVVLERKAHQDSEDITSGELLAPHTQLECAELGLDLSADWLFDRVTGVRNVYPDLSWTYHPFPSGMSYVNVDRGGLNTALQRRLLAFGGTIVWNARVTEVELRADAAVVRTAEGNEHRGALLIDAGGRYSPTIRTLGLKAEDPEFRQIGVALFFESFADAPLNTWDRHMHGERGVLVSGSRIRPGLYRYILEADLADKQSTRLPPVEFYESMIRTYDAWLYERIIREPRVGRVWSMAPIGYRVTEVARDRLLLAGDAAGYLSPITGQGVEFAMRMGRLAAAAALDGLNRGDVTAATFADYVEARRGELDTALAYVRHQLRHMRDRDALLRAAHDDDYRIAVFGPAVSEIASRGSLA